MNGNTWADMKFEIITPLSAVPLKLCSAILLKLISCTDDSILY